MDLYAIDDATKTAILRCANAALLSGGLDALSDVNNVIATLQQPFEQPEAVPEPVPQKETTEL